MSIWGLVSCILRISSLNAKSPSLRILWRSLALQAYTFCFLIQGSGSLRQSSKLASDLLGSNVTVILQAPRGQYSLPFKKPRRAPRPPLSSRASFILFVGRRGRGIPFEALKLAYIPPKGLCKGQKHWTKLSGNWWETSVRVHGKWWVYMPDTPNECAPS